MYRNAHPLADDCTWSAQTGGYVGPGSSKHNQQPSTKLDSIIEAVLMTGAGLWATLKFLILLALVGKALLPLLFILALLGAL